MTATDRPVHVTELREMGRSPAHYRARLLEPREPTAAMAFGSLAHALVLGGKYSLYEGERRGNAWKAFAAEHAGELIVTPTEHARAMRVRDAVRSHPIAGPLLEVRHEVPARWTYLGREMSTHGLDVLHPARVVDLKTSSTTEPGRFRRACLAAGYHSQLAAYVRHAAPTLGVRPEEGWIVGVETAPPFAVTVFRLTPRCLDAGEKLLRCWMERLLSCEAANEWPAYAQTELPLDVEDEEPLGLLIDGEEVAGEMARGTEHLS